MKGFSVFKVRNALPGLPPDSESVLLQRGDLVVKLAATPFEIKSCYKLRYRIFSREYAKKLIPFGKEKDQYDQHAHHLMVVNKNNGIVCGYYRLILDQPAHHYYSASEFELDSFLARPGRKLELSRACIHPKFRSGFTLTLLWRGLLNYARQNNVDTIFGIPSLKSEDATEVFNVYRNLLEAGHVDPATPCYPKEMFRHEELQNLLASPPIDAPTQLPDASSNKKIPPLLMSYIKAGAKILGEPAFDSAFRCFDLFTCLDISNMSQQYNKYQLPH